MSWQKRPRVLYVDDDIYVMQGCIEALIDAGYEVSPADSVDEALALAATEAFEVVILDIMMPPGRAFTAIETAGGFKTGIA